jgi:hypothetical protein
MGGVIMKTQIILLNNPVDKKHSVCYKAHDKEAPVQSIYLMRSAFKPEKAPKTIKVTIEEVL